MSRTTNFMRIGNYPLIQHKIEFHCPLAYLSNQPCIYGRISSTKTDTHQPKPKIMSECLKPLTFYSVQNWHNHNNELTILASPKYSEAVIGTPAIVHSIVSITWIVCAVELLVCCCVAAKLEEIFRRGNESWSATSDKAISIWRNTELKRNWRRSC